MPRLLVIDDDASVTRGLARLFGKRDHTVRIVQDARRALAVATEFQPDAVILDLATPWLAVPHAHRALTGGGVFASFSPTIEQVMRTVSALRGSPFVEVETVELILRRIIVAEGRTRPETLMIGHSGYTTTARKATS